MEKPLDDERGRPARRMLNLEQVLEIVPVSRSNLFKMMKEGNFPPGVFISPNRRVWYEDVVVGWQVDLEQRPTRRRRRSKRVSSQV